jgi:hypothetical protein
MDASPLKKKCCRVQCWAAGSISVELGGREVGGGEYYVTLGGNGAVRISGNGGVHLRAFVRGYFWEWSCAFVCAFVRAFVRAFCVEICFHLNYT